MDDRKDMLKNKDSQVLGLFADGGLPKKIDRTKDIPSLKDMTNTAIKN